MKNRRILLKYLVSLSLLLIIMATCLISINISSAQPPLEVSVKINKSLCYEREEVILSGNVTQGGIPVSNALVALDLRKMDGTPFIFRTLTVGNPVENWPLTVTRVFITESLVNPTAINVVKSGSSVFVNANVSNPQLTDRWALVTVTVFDGSLTPIAVKRYEGTIPKQGFRNLAWEVDIPKWSKSGVGSIVCNVYTGEPKFGGRPYCPEKSANFFISRYEQGVFGYQIPTVTQPPLGTGEYISSFRVPSSSNRAYSVYTIARVSPISFSSTETTAFTIGSTPTPPEPSFAYFPINPYRNMSVKFDASFSSAGGFNDTIVSYKWTWGDGTSITTTNPIIYKTFTGVASRYLVVLNVTDAESLSATESKYVYIKSPNPTAYFIWTPSTGTINRPITFNASLSDAGWDVSKGTYATISQYKWNFGDSPANITTAIPVTSKSYSTPGNYTVTLTVTSSAGLFHSTSQIVRVQNITLVGDITGVQGVPDGKVDIMDLALASSCFGSYPGHPKWDPRADITGAVYLVPDGKVDIMDIALVSGNFGEHL